MNKAFSIYLDIVRFTAACLVYLWHSNQRLLVTDILPFSSYGHSSVIVFFVLSGFVIAYVTDTKENNFPSYAASRISRIYSVALPTVFLTLALDAVGRQLYPELYDYPFDQFLVRIASSLLLLNEVWFVSITSFSNVPYWSICYEMWYYVAFGLVVFCPGRLGIVLAAGLGLVLGPKVLLLAPIWFAGVVLYRWKALARLPESVAWILAVGSVVGIFAYHQVGVANVVAEQVKGVIGPRWHVELTFSKYFLSDYLLGLLVFLNFAAMRVVCKRLSPALLAIERPVRILAGYTLTLYLLHQPFILFWASVLRGDPSGHGYWWATTALATLSVVVVGQLTEHRRGALRRWLEAWFSQAALIWSTRRPAPTGR